LTLWYSREGRKHENAEGLSHRPDPRSDDGYIPGSPEEFGDGDITVLVRETVSPTTRLHLLGPTEPDGLKKTQRLDRLSGYG